MSSLDESWVNAFKVHFEDIFINFFNYLKKNLNGHKLFLYPIQIKRRQLTIKW
jgi:hypothetical protein